MTKTAKQMNKFYLLLMLLSTTAFGQQTTVKEAFLEKWNNSRDYLIAVAEAMPEATYNYKPTERQMSFAEQLVHIQGNIDWLSATYFDVEKSKNPKDIPVKHIIISNLIASFNRTSKAIDKMPENQLENSVDFFAGPKSKLQILNLLQDHVTHHRGQLIVYLNLNEIEPPRFSGW